MKYNKPYLKHEQAGWNASVILQIIKIKAKKVQPQNIININVKYNVNSRISKIK